MSDDKEPRVVLSAQAQAQADEDEDLQKFLVKFSADCKNAMLAMQAGRYKDFGEAMIALGYEADRSYEPDDDDEDN